MLSSTSSKNAKQAKLQPTRKDVQTPFVKGTKDVPAHNVKAKTKIERKSLDNNIPDHLARIIRPNHDKVFSNLKHVRCKLSSCTFCKQLWYALPYSKCSEIACHVKNTTCHESGWYKHVLPIAWSKLRKSHESGKLPKKYSNTYLLEELDNPSASEKSNNSLSSASTITDIASMTSSTASKNKRLARFEAEYCKTGSSKSSVLSSGSSLAVKVRKIDLDGKSTLINPKGHKSKKH